MTSAPCAAATALAHPGAALAFHHSLATQDDGGSGSSVASDCKEATSPYTRSINHDSLARACVFLHAKALRPSR